MESSDISAVLKTLLSEIHLLPTQESLDTATRDLLKEIHDRIEYVNKDKVEEFMQNLEEKIRDGYNLRDILKAVTEYEKKSFSVT